MLKYRYFVFISERLLTKTKSFLLPIALLGLIIYLFVNIYNTYQVVQIEPDIAQELKIIATPNYLEIHIAQSLKNDDIEDAQRYANLAQYLHIDINKSLKDKIDEENSFISKSMRSTQQFTDGFITGKADSAIALSGCILSDFTLVGDARDMYQEGSKMIANEDYDKFTLSIATIGIALTATTYLSAGAEVPLRVGASVIKVAKKTGALSKNFIKIVSSKLSKAVDIKILKKVNLHSISDIKKSSSFIVKHIDFTSIKKLFTDISKITKNSGNEIDAIKLMKYADKPKDLNKVVKLSKKFKGNTLIVLKILGKGALKSGKMAIKYTSLLIAKLIALAVSFFSFLGLLIMKYFFYKRLKVNKIF